MRAKATPVAKMESTSAPEILLPPLQPQRKPCDCRFASTKLALQALTRTTVQRRSLQGMYTPKASLHPKRTVSSEKVHFSPTIQSFWFSCYAEIQVSKNIPNIGSRMLGITSTYLITLRHSNHVRSFHSNTSNQ